MFNDAALKFDNIIEEGKVYVIKYGKVRIANKLYTSVPNEYNLTFDINSEFELAEEHK
jgi:hypothetical protein